MRNYYINHKINTDHVSKYSGSSLCDNLPHIKETNWHVIELISQENNEMITGTKWNQYRKQENIVTMS